MAKILLITNPNQEADPATQYFYAWSKGIIDRIRERGNVVVYELEGSSVNHKKFSEIVKKERPNFIILNGHGSERTITGFDSDILIRYQDNEYLLKDAIVHTLACESGKLIGPECIRVGTVAYIGYKEKFRGAYDPRAATVEARQLDPYAELIMDPAFEVITAIAKGDSVNTAYQRSRHKYAENLASLLTTPNATNTAIAIRIRDNLNNQVCLGNESAVWA